MKDIIHQISNSVPGSLTMKRDSTKWSHAKRIVAVPELLSERAELTKQSVETEPLQIYLESDGIEQDATEMKESILQPLLKDDVVESMPEMTTQLVEIVEEKAVDNPLSAALSYSIPRTSVLVLTSDGNYMITKLGDDIMTSANALQFTQPQVKEIIILNGNNLQQTNMGIDYEPIIQQTVIENNR